LAFKVRINSEDSLGDLDRLYVHRGSIYNEFIKVLHRKGSGMEVLKLWVTYVTVTIPFLTKAFMSVRSFACLTLLLPFVAAYKDTIPVVAWSSHELALYSEQGIIF